MRSALFQLDTMEVLVSLIASGACEKYPDFNFVLGESGVTWLPYVFDRLDTEYEDRARSLGFKLKPSDYFRRQGYVTYQQDQYLEPIIPLIGEDNIIWGADYPHPDCIWPDSRAHLEKNLGGFSASRAAQDHLRQRGEALQPPREKGFRMTSAALDIPSVKDKVSPEEWAARVDLAAAYRLVSLYGWDDLVFTHISPRVPGTEDQFLINPYGAVLRRDHRLQPGQDRPRRQEARWTRRSRSTRPASSSTAPSTPRAHDANCVLHTHTAAGVAVSAQRAGLLPISQHSMFVLTSLGYHDYEGAGAPRRREAAPGRRPRRHELA